jgi:carboxyl-terminal processing protease
MKKLQKLTAVLLSAVIICLTPVTATAYDYQDYLKDAADITEIYTDRERIFELGEVVTKTFPDYWEDTEKYGALYDAITILIDKDDVFYKEFGDALIDIQKEYALSSLSLMTDGKKNSENIDAQYKHTYSITLKGDLLETVLDRIIEEKPEYTDILINEIIALTDQYSRYIKAEDYYVGQIEDNVGLGVYGDNLGSGVYIAGVFDGSGAAEAGIVKGDIVTAINGVPYSVELLSSLSGAAGTDATLTVLREDGEKEDITVTRKTFSEGKVTSKRIDDTVVISFKAFILFSDAEDFEKYYDEAAADPTVKKLVIDLRDNTGGDTDVLKKIASVIAPKNTVLYSFVSKEKTVVFRSDGRYKGKGKKFGGQLFVLTDGVTASAADVLTTVIKNNGGIQVGAPTYAKGIGQDGFILHNGYMAWITGLILDVPTYGRYHGKPIVPDVSIENTELMFAADEVILPLDTSVPLTSKSSKEQIKAYEQRLQAMYRIKLVVDGELDLRTKILTNGAKTGEWLPLLPLDDSFAVDTDFLKFIDSVATDKYLKESLIESETDKVLEYCLDYEIKAKKAA